jgi:hypothetical protein
MVESNDPIPAEGIYLLDAFEYLFRAMNPNWRELEDRCNEPAIEVTLDIDSNEEMNRHLQDEAFLEYDLAQLSANKWLRSHIGDGSITAFIRDPSNDKSLQLSRQGWENVGFDQSGISSNFVSPDDLLNPGPDAEINGSHRPVFLLRDEFRKCVQTAFGSIESPALKSGLEASAVSGRGRMTRSIQQAFRELFPSGVIPTGMSSQTRNDRILKQLKDVEKIDPLPYKRTIERAIRALLK